MPRHHSHRERLFSQQKEKWERAERAKQEEQTRETYTVCWFKPIFCMYCGEEGHAAPFCPIFCPKIYDALQKKTQDQVKKITIPEQGCINCHALGHNILYCPKDPDALNEDTQAARNKIFTSWEPVQPTPTCLKCHKVGHSTPTNWTVWC